MLSFLRVMAVSFNTFVIIFDPAGGYSSLNEWRLYPIRHTDLNQEANFNKLSLQSNHMTK